MRLSKEKNRELLEVIRREMVKNPAATIFELQEALDKEYNHAFDKNFIGKLKNKIHRERAYRLHNSIVYELALFEDTINELCRILWEIFDNPNTNNREKISAIREIWSAKNRFLDAKLNAGIFRQQAEIKKDEELSPEDKALIKQAIGYATGRSEKFRAPQNN